MKYFNKTSLILFLVLTNIVSVIWYVTRPSPEELFKNQYPYINPARNFISQNDFIVNIQPLRKKLFAMASDFESKGGHISLYLEFLNTGGNISINPNTYIFPASLTKLPIAMVVMKKIENGEWKLSDELVLAPQDRNAESGDEENPLAEYPVGTRFSIERLLKELLVNSDNTAALMFSRNLHEDELYDIVEEVGLEDLFTGEGRYSAKEYSRLFRSLYTSSFLTRTNSQYLLELLDRATFNDFLTSVVPENVPFPHKYGVGAYREGTNFYADSGIVYTPERPYLITVMVEGVKTEDFEERTKLLMHEVSLTAYDYFSNYEK